MRFAHPPCKPSLAWISEAHGGRSSGWVTQRRNVFHTGACEPASPATSAGRAAWAGVPRVLPATASSGLEVPRRVEGPAGRDAHRDVTAGLPDYGFGRTLGPLDALPLDRGGGRQGDLGAGPHRIGAFGGELESLGRVPVAEFGDAADGVDRLAPDGVAVAALEGGGLLLHDRGRFQREDEGPGGDDRQDRRLGADQVRAGVEPAGVGRLQRLRARQGRQRDAVQGHPVGPHPVRDQFDDRGPRGRCALVGPVRGGDGDRRALAVRGELLGECGGADHAVVVRLGSRRRPHRG